MKKKVYQYIPLMGVICPRCQGTTDLVGKCSCFGVVTQTIREITVDIFEGTDADVYATQMSSPRNS